MIIDENKVTDNPKRPSKKNIEEKIKSKSEDGIIKLLQEIVLLIKKVTQPF